MLQLHLNLLLPLIELITCKPTQWVPAKYSKMGEKKTITANICEEVAMVLFQHFCGPVNQAGRETGTLMTPDRQKEPKYNC